MARHPSTPSCGRSICEATYHGATSFDIKLRTTRGRLRRSLLAGRTADIHNAHARVVPHVDRAADTCSCVRAELAGQTFAAMVADLGFRRALVSSRGPAGRCGQPPVRQSG
eukprot:365996-Chlamydomonas_euryale.AAC.6